MGSCVKQGGLNWSNRKNGETLAKALFLLYIYVYIPRASRQMCTCVCWESHTGMFQPGVILEISQICAAVVFKTSSEFVSYFKNKKWVNNEILLRADHFLCKCGCLLFKFSTWMSEGFSVKCLTLNPSHCIYSHLNNIPEVISLSLLFL